MNFMDFFPPLITKEQSSIMIQQLVTHYLLNCNEFQQMKKIAATIQSLEHDNGNNRLSCEQELVVKIEACKTFYDIYELASNLPLKNTTELKRYCVTFFSGYLYPQSNFTYFQIKFKANLVRRMEEVGQSPDDIIDGVKSHYSSFT